MRHITASIENEFADMLRRNLTYITVDGYDASKVHGAIVSDTMDILKKHDFKFDEEKFIDLVYKFYPEQTR